LLGGSEADAEKEPARASAWPPGLGAPTVSAGSRGTSVGFPSPAPASAPRTSAVWAPAPADAPPAAPPSSLTRRRALPTDRRLSSRPDFMLLLASVAAVGAAVLAWQAIADPWVKLVITDTSERLDPQLVGEITLRGQSALVGVIGQAIAAVLGVYGAIWFFFGFDRGSTMPWFVNPAIAILSAIGGAIGAVLSGVLWFVWQDAAVQHAKAVRMSAWELRALLEHQPIPLVEIQQLSGLMRFGGAMVIGVLAACTAWWSYRKRS
ncbi:MAG: hypothetical protein ACRDHU_01610, partial [Actinomycetota bacterium]